jgi:DNA adenine methylase
LDKQIPKLANIDFIHDSYENIEIQGNMVIYCDPPYKGVIGYRSLKGKFDHTAFWEWAEDMTRQGHTVIVSEGEAPEGWEIVYDHMTSRGIRADDVEDRYFKDRLFMFNLEV